MMDRVGEITALTPSPGSPRKTPTQIRLLVTLGVTSSVMSEVTFKKTKKTGKTLHGAVMCMCVKFPPLSLQSYWFHHLRCQNCLAVTVSVNSSAIILPQGRSTSWKSSHRSVQMSKYASGALVHLFAGYRLRAA